MQQLNIQPFASWGIPRNAAFSMQTFTIEECMQTFITSPFEKLFTDTSSTRSYLRALDSFPNKNIFLEVDGDKLRKLKREGENGDCITIRCSEEKTHSHARCKITLEDDAHRFWDSVQNHMHKLMETCITSSIKSTSTVFKTDHILDEDKANKITLLGMVAIISDHLVQFLIYLDYKKAKDYSCIDIYMWQHPLRYIHDPKRFEDKRKCTWTDATAENKVLAALMATHARLGTDSKLGELMNEIFPFIVNEYDKINTYTWSEIENIVKDKENMAIVRRYLPHLALHIGHDGNGMSSVAHNGDSSGRCPLSSLVGI